MKLQRGAHRMDNKKWIGSSQHHPLALDGRSKSSINRYIIQSLSCHLPICTNPIISSTINIFISNFSSSQAFILSIPSRQGYKDENSYVIIPGSTTKSTSTSTYPTLTVYSRRTPISLSSKACMVDKGGLHAAGGLHLET